MVQQRRKRSNGQPTVPTKDSRPWTCWWEILPSTHLLELNRTSYPQWSHDLSKRTFRKVSRVWSDGKTEGLPDSIAERLKIALLYILGHVVSVGIPSWLCLWCFNSILCIIHKTCSRPGRYHFTRIKNRPPWEYALCCATAQCTLPTELRFSGTPSALGVYCAWLP